MRSIGSTIIEAYGETEITLWDLGDIYSALLSRNMVE